MEQTHYPLNQGSILDRLDVGVLALDATGRVLFANSAAAGLLGTDQLEAKPIVDLVRLDPAARARVGRLLSAGSETQDRLTVRGVSIESGQIAAGGGGRMVDAFFRAAPPSAGCAAVATIVDVAARLSVETELSRVRERLAESERARQKLTTLQEELSEQNDSVEMIGRSDALDVVRSQVRRVAPTDTTVLIHGETGTGKELVARSIHAESPRARRAFVPVNCAAIPENLVESELFGHERGAFTGADRRRLGKFELADAGTLFLDEAAELGAGAQAKLLRVLQEGAFERVGGSETVRVNVRVVAATHRDLARQVERGLFREDLFYRLNVFRIEVPPLRDRPEDLRALLEHLHARVARRLARPVLPLSERSLRKAIAYRWPGNVRELANAVERATLLADGPELDIELPDSPVPQHGARRRRTSGEAAPGDGGFGSGGGGGEGGASATTRDVLLDLTMEQLQRLHLMHALESCGYRVFGRTGAARKLEVNPNTLLSRMDKFGIPRPRAVRRGRNPDEA